MGIGSVVGSIVCGLNLTEGISVFKHLDLALLGIKNGVLNMVEVDHWNPHFWSKGYPHRCM